jgi:hypothetical protein
MRAAILTVSFLPFLYYGTKDTLFHFRGRKVTGSEHLLHAVIGLVLAIMFTHALQGHHLVVLGALLLFVVPASTTLSTIWPFEEAIPGASPDRPPRSA